jgi:hypothetical protein
VKEEFKMAKIVHNISLKGKLVFEVDQWVIVEETKEGETRYSLNKIIEEFFNQKISISVKRESELDSLVEVDHV